MLKGRDDRHLHQKISHLEAPVDHVVPTCSNLFSFTETDIEWIKKAVQIPCNEGYLNILET